MTIKVETNLRYERKKTVRRDQCVFQNNSSSLDWTITRVMLELLAAKHINPLSASVALK